MGVKSVHTNTVSAKDPKTLHNKSSEKEMSSTFSPSGGYLI